MFHVRFQALIAMRPWEMESADRDEWERIEQMVDVTAYRRETPRRVRQIGTIAQARQSGTRGHSPQTGPFQPRHALPNKIQWESGRHEDIDLSVTVADFAGLRYGQRFEAVAVRDVATDRLVAIVDVVLLPPLPSAADARSLLDSVPKSNELEPVDWGSYE